MTAPENFLSLIVSDAHAADPAPAGGAAGGFMSFLPLIIIFVIFYFLLPIGAAYFQDLFSIKVWGVVNFGLLFALGQFVVAWLVAFYYSRRASTEFDRAAAEIAASYEKKGRG